MKTILILSTRWGPEACLILMVLFIRVHWHLKSASGCFLPSMLMSGMNILTCCIHYSSSVSLSVSSWLNWGFAKAKKGFCQRNKYFPSKHLGRQDLLISSLKKKSQLQTMNPEFPVHLRPRMGELGEEMTAGGHRLVPQESAEIEKS